MYSIAIDGPAGAGKSTIAKAIAEDIGCRYRSNVPGNRFIFFA